VRVKSKAERKTFEPGKQKSEIDETEIAEKERGSSTWIYPVKGKDAGVRKSRWWLRLQVGDQRQESPLVR
jgi:hypothetical protein